VTGSPLRFTNEFIFLQSFQIGFLTLEAVKVKGRQKPS